MQTVFDLLRLASRRAPNQVAICDDVSPRSLTYSQLVDTVDRLAAGFEALGIARGGVVATCLGNCFEHCLVLLALERIGAVPALINPRLKSVEVGRLIDQGRMVAAVVKADNETINAAKFNLPPSAPIVTVGESVEGSIDLKDCVLSANTPGEYIKPDAEDTAFVFYTSGTTGLPKGAEIPHRATESRLLYMSTQCGLVHGTQNKILGLMPLFHVVGFYSVFLAALGFDGTYFVSTEFKPTAAIEQIKRNEISLLYGAPTHFHAILDAPNFAPEMISSVNTMVYAGASMPGPLLDRLGSISNAKIINIYGTTEVMNALYMPDPIGRPLTYRPGFFSDVRVCRIGGGIHDEADIGEDGELLVDVSADAAFKRYLHRPDETNIAVDDGWYRTGDIAVRRADGDYDVRGRVDDMILSGGENIYPDEVESILLKHNHVKECCVIGLDDAKWGEIVLACVVGSDAALNEIQLDAYMRDSKLADFKRPRKYLFLAELPKNAANKVLRRELRDQALELSV